MSDTPFAIAIEIDAGRLPGSATLDIRRITDLVLAAESFGVTAVTFADVGHGAVAGGRALDPVQVASYAAPSTRSIGLIPTTRPGHAEPFHVATQLASLDWVADGRAGWLPLAIEDEAENTAEAAAFGHRVLSSADQRRERDDAIEVSRRLWDSWEDDAVIADVATGRYLDADRLHYVDFVGETYRITGPLITPRPPQGQLVVVSSADAVGVDVVLATDTGGARPAGAARVWADLEVDLAGRSDAASAAADVAARIAQLATSVEGVRLRSTDPEADLEVVGRHVLPLLRDSIGFRSPRAGDTLRATLGLERPRNRYAEGEAA